MVANRLSVGQRGSIFHIIDGFSKDIFSLIKLHGIEMTKSGCILWQSGYTKCLYQNSCVIV